MKKWGKNLEGFSEVLFLEGRWNVLYNLYLCLVDGYDDDDATLKRLLFVVLL